jgi:hypothetical protein
MLPDNFPVLGGAAPPNQVGGVHGGEDQYAARGEVVSAVAERYRAASRLEKGRILDELCAVTGWHRKHAIRALTSSARARLTQARQRGRAYGASIRGALIALWEPSDGLCGKRLAIMVPTLLPALERHGRLKLDVNERVLVLQASAATIDRLLSDVKVTAAGGRRRRAGFSSAVRRQVPVRTFNDWGRPPPGYCKADLVAHGGTLGIWTHPDAHDGGCGDRLDRVLPARSARGGSRRRNDRSCTEPVPLADSGARLRQRQRIHE